MTIATRRPGIDSPLAAVAAQQRQEGLGQADRRLEVDLHVALDVGPTALAEAAPPRRARIVDEQMQAPSSLLDHTLHARGGIVISEIERQRPGPLRPTELGGEGVQPLGSAGDEDQLHVGFAGQSPCGGLADSTRGAGDQREIGHCAAAYGTGLASEWVG